MQRKSHRAETSGVTLPSSVSSIKADICMSVFSKCLICVSTTVTIWFVLSWMCNYIYKICWESDSLALLYRHCYSIEIFIPKFGARPAIWKGEINRWNRSQWSICTLFYRRRNNENQSQLWRNINTKHWDESNTANKFNLHRNNSDTSLPCFCKNK